MDKRGKANGKVANVAEAEEVFKQFALQKTKEYKEEERQRHKKKLVCTNTELNFLVFFSTVFFYFCSTNKCKKI